MGKIVALDIGSRRTGIAETDDMQLIASPLTTVATHELMPYLENHFKKNKVDLVVFGDPKTLSGDENEGSAVKKDMLERFQRRFPAMPFENQDERFTSKMALDAQIAGGMKKSKRKEKGSLDVIAACLILQSYLESRKWQ